MPVLFLWREGKTVDFRLLTEKETEKWYREELCEAFAPQECKPLLDIFSLIANHRYELWGLFEGKKLLGYAALWKAPGVPLVLLDYLGVTARRRNSGLGAEILRRLRTQGHLIVAESEEEVPGDREEANQIRRRRIAFYQRNGFAPAYRMATCGMAWQALLSDSHSFPPEDVMNWHRTLYGPDRKDVQIPLPPGAVPQMPYWME